MKHLKRTRDNFFHIIIFAAMFALIGHFLPNVIYTIMPGEFFYRATATSVQYIESQCPTTYVTIERRVIKSTHGARFVELQLLNKDGTIEQINIGALERKLRDEFVLEKTNGYEPLVFKLDLPCDIQRDQTYRWMMLVEFDINKVQKAIEITTPHFISHYKFSYIWKSNNIYSKSHFMPGSLLHLLKS